ncbi:MAG: lipopolysaccharide export system permease protein [Bacteriovoracaceae bacterium]|jgi:lipopolysaccharide export system permease protein
MTLVSSDEISFWFILGMMGNVMTTLIPMAIPISIFFSTIFSLSRMSGDSEYVALRAAGLQKINILLPFMVVAIVVSICVFFLNQELVPNAHGQVRKKIKIISSTSLIQGLKSGQFFTNLNNVTIFPSQVDDVTKDLSNVFLHIYDDQNNIEKVIVAKKGKILHKKDVKTGIESFKLLLKNGNIVNKSIESPDVEKILFDEYILPISEKRFSYQTSMKEIMMNRAELEEFIDGGLANAKKAGFDKKDYFNAKYEYWNRINTPILVMIFTFLGFTLGITGNRGRSKNSSGKAILLLIGYYVFYFTVVSAARDGTVPVILCAILPNLALLAYATKSYRNLDWLS